MDDVLMRHGTEILEMKNSICQIKNWVTNLNNIFCEVEERLSKLEDDSLKYLSHKKTKLENWKQYLGFMR